MVVLVVGWLSGGALYAAWGEMLPAGVPESHWRALCGAIAVGGAVAALCAPRIAVCARSVWSPHGITLAATALAASAWLGADARTTHDGACARLAGARGAPWLVRLDDPGAPSRRATGVLIASTPVSCTLPVTLSIARGEAQAGALVQVRGALLPVRVGQRVELRMTNARVTPTARVSTLAAWRARTGARIDALFAEHAPIVRALITADQRGIPVNVRDQFATVGLVHVLSISGLHVAIIAGALRTIGMALRLSRAVAGAGALLTVFAYVLVLGLPAPAVRAAVMLLVVIGTTLLDRPVHPWTALALGVVTPTADPRVIGSLGWQLSAAGMAALVASRTLLRRWRAPRHDVLRSPWRRAIVHEMVTGILASAVTLPLVAWTFGRVSLVAPLSNVLASPVVTMLQPMLFLAVVLDRVPLVQRIAPFVADAARVPLAVLQWVAAALERIPYAALSVSPTWYTAVLLGVAAGAVVVATARRRIIPTLRVALGAVALALWLPVVLPGPRRFELHMIDVGQGDAIALRSPRGRWVLVDAGRAWEGGDAGRRTVVPYVRRLGGEVAAFVLTHGDADHAGGAASVLEALRPSLWWEPGFVMGSAVYRRALAAADRLGVAWQRVHIGDTLHIDGVRLTALAPDSLWTAAQRDPNNASVVLLAEYGAHRVLLTGDAEADQEAWLVQRWGSALRADVLKVGHHGSRSSTTAEFLAQVQPTLALISVGAGNRYGHPSPMVLNALVDAGVTVVRTDEEGAVVLASDGREWLVRTTRDPRWARYPTHP